MNVRKLMEFSDVLFTDATLNVSQTPQNNILNRNFVLFEFTV